MSTIDLICPKCGLLAIVPDQGKPGLKYECRCCGTILELPGDKHPEAPPGGGEIRHEPEPLPAKPKPYNTGWGRVTPLPESPFKAAEVCVQPDGDAWRPAVDVREPRLHDAGWSRDASA